MPSALGLVVSLFGPKFAVMKDFTELEGSPKMTGFDFISALAVFANSSLESASSPLLKFSTGFQSGFARTFKTSLKRDPVFIDAHSAL